MRRLWWKVARSSPGASALIALIVLVSTAVLTAWPMVLRDLGERAQQDAAADTPAVTRALRAEVSMPTMSDSTGRPLWGAIDEAMSTFSGSWQPALTDIAGPGEALVSGDGQEFDGPTAIPEGLSARLLELRTIRTLADHVTFVDGGMPSPPRGVGDPIEVVVSATTATELGLTTGDELALDLFDYSTGEPTRLLVVGTFESDADSEEYFDHQIGALEPSYIDDPNLGVWGTGAAYTDSETAALVGSLYGGVRLQTWYPLRPDFDDGAAVQLALQDATARAVAVSTLSGTVELAYTTALSERLAVIVAQTRATTGTLALVASGPIGVMFALVASVARLATMRRAPTLSLARARGGSPARIRSLLAIEGLVLGLVPAGLGVAAAALVAPDRLALGDLVLPVLLALAPALALALAPQPSLRTTRPDQVPESGRRMRRLLEIVSVALAAAAVYLVLAAGVDDAGSPDVIASATPLLLAIALAVLAARLLGGPLAALHAVVRRGRRLPAFLGSARASRERSGGLVSLLSLLVGVTIAVFSTTMLTTIDHGLREGAYSRTGADIAISGSYYAPEEIAAVGEIEGVAAVASAREFPATALYVDGRFTRLSVYAVDTATLAQVQQDVPGALAVPAGTDELIDGALPILVSTSYGDLDGEEVAINIEGQLPVDVVARADEAPGIVTYPDDPWAVVDAGLLRELTDRPLPSRQVLVRFEPGADVAAVTEQVMAALGGRGGIVSTQDQVDDVADTPLAAALSQGFTVALVLSGLQSVLAITLALIIAAPSRRRLLGVLRTLGARARDTRALLGWEIAPTAVVAVVGGAALGLVLPHLIVAAIDLRGFTAGAQPAVSYDPARLALVVLAATAAVALITTAAGTIARRGSITELRVGEAS